MRNIQYFYSTTNNERGYIDFRNVYYGIDGIAEDKKIPAIDGLSWDIDKNTYSIDFKNQKVGGVYIPERKNKIFIRYKGVSPSFPAPNNLVVYTPTGEIEKVLSTPILPTGEQGAGFLAIHGLDNWDKNTIPKGFENWLYVNVWEEGVYTYFFNPDTYEFVFYISSRY